MDLGTGVVGSGSSETPLTFLYHTNCPMICDFSCRSAGAYQSYIAAATYQKIQDDIEG